MHDWTDAKLRELILEITRRATVDPEFRRLALTDSRAAIGVITTTPLPPAIEFRFVDNSGRLKTVPLPDPVFEVFTDELSEEELDRVAGGTPPYNVEPGGGG